MLVLLQLLLFRRWGGSGARAVRMRVSEAWLEFWLISLESLLVELLLKRYGIFGADAVHLQQWLSAVIVLNSAPN